MCLIVCLTTVAVQQMLSYMGAGSATVPLPVMAGVAATCAWLAVAPPSAVAMSFLPALGGLAYGTVAMLARQRMVTDEALFLAIREAVSKYAAALALLLVGLAVLTRRSRLCDRQPEGIFVYSGLDRTANARELWVASAAFLSAGLFYVTTAMLTPSETLPIAQRLTTGFALCAAGIAVQELWGYLLLRPDTFRRLLEESQPVSAAVRMTGWLVGSFLAGVLIASVLVVTLNVTGRPFVAYIWIGAGSWFGVAHWIRREFVKMESAQATAKMLQMGRVA
ncbi:MAG: hypothetical protein ABSD31_00605 [Candidatus Binataceae bacterium]|jgi:hypothetical protein